MLLEPRAPGPVIANPLGVDPRTVALSAASRTLLQAVRGWPPELATPVSAMEIGEARGTAQLRFSPEDADQEALAWVVEVGPWRNWWWPRLADAGVTHFAAALTGIESNGAGYRLALAGNDGTALSPLQVDRVVAADGVSSRVRAEFGVPLLLEDTGQSAIASAARFERPHTGIAWQRFGIDGPLALLPLAPQHTMSVVWSCASERAAELAAGDFATALGRASGERFGAALETLRGVVLPLRQGVVERFCPASGVTLIGDAARQMHPLAGQGMNLGLEDVSALLAEDPPATFERRRRSRTLLMLKAMSGFSRAYGSARRASRWRVTW